MKIGVFADVHGNLIALERFIESTEGVVDEYICLGDTVNYGPWNDECLELVSQLPGIRTVEGNHERIFRNGDFDNQSPLVQAFSHHSRKFFSRTDLIAALPHSIELGPFSCTHTVQGAYVFPDSTIDVERDYLLGHSHHQFQIRRSGCRVANPGSVGQNRAWIDMVDYLIVDTVSWELMPQSVAYDIDGFLAELKRRDYPEQCIAYYAGKRRRLI